MRRLVILLVAPMMVLFFVSLAFAPTDPIPHLMNYQGVLTDDGGIPLNGTYDLTFSIYSVSSGGSALWDEIHNDVSVDNGLFGVILGSTESIPSSVFEGAERYLGTKVGADPELTPRTRLTSVGYAYRAEVADTAYYAIEAVSAETDGDWTISGSDIYSAVSGNVGIGTSSPTAPLTIQPVNGADIEFAGGGGWNADIKANNQFNIGTANASTFHLMTNNAYRLNISGDGDIGIGTTSPGAVLDVYGTRNTGATSDGIVNIGSSSGYHVTLDRNEIHGRNGSSTSDLYINDFGGNVLIAKQGNVGIGTTSPSEKLEVSGNIELSGIIKGQVPGLDYVNASGLGTQTNISTSWLTLKSVTVTHPGTGYVICIGTGHCDFDLSSYTGSVYAGWTTSSSGTPVSYNRISLSVADYTTYIPLTAMHTFTVSGSGSTTFYFRAKISSGASTDMDFFEGSVAAMYFPTKY